ncbi:MAG: C40 family peptidase [Tannerella sp.]|jgi:cell wall-associated NlpC family hydrolase|nr:C40 family peptidase [Tannerella sp.]
MERLISYSYILLLVTGLCFSSCTTRRYVASTPPPPPVTSKPVPTKPAASEEDKAEARRLTQELGFKVTSKDNLKLYRYVAGWIGTPYRYGGTSRKGTDCSGFVMNIYQDVYGKKIERSTANILKINCLKVPLQEDLHEGNLVFLHNGDRSKISHVGIYLKKGRFAHASSIKGVTISNLQDNYYLRHWITGGVVKD